MEKLSELTSAMSAKLGGVLPSVLGAIAVLIIGFFVANIVKRLVMRLLKSTSIDEKIGEKMNTSFRVDTFIAKLIYYLLLIYTLMVVLNMLGVDSVLEPIQGMMAKFVGYIPNVVGAGVIGFAGYMIASIVSEATGFLSERLEGYSQKLGFNTGEVNLTKIVRQLVFILIFIPIFIMALDTLKMDAISKPATQMLSTLLEAIPMIIAAIILLAIFYFVGKYVVSVIVTLLNNFGVDRLASNAGLQNVIGDNVSLSAVIGKVIMFFIMFTGIIAAADKLGLGQVNVILNDVLNIAGKVFFGLIVLMGGIYVSNIASKVIKNSGSAAFAPIVRFAILGIFLAFALNTMGIAESIVNLAFGLTLGAVAVAFALSFGLGGREAAGKEMENFFKNLRK